MTDTHALSAAAVLESEFGVDTIIWDSGRIPMNNTVSFVLGNSKNDFWLTDSKRHISPDAICSIWWRRSGKYNIDQSVNDPKVRDFCLRECDSMFRGLIDSIEVPVVNDPVNESVAVRKPVQLKEAQQVGLSIPKTIMSNDKDRIIDFWKGENGNCIYKAFTPASWRVADTRMLTEDNLKHLDKLRHSPIIVQEKIERGSDIRVNIFGNDIFAASVNTSEEIDWRLDPAGTWKEHELPDIVGKQLILLLKNLGLYYGCIDLRQQPDGRYVFLEINPSGQFLFIEIDTGQPLTRSLAKLLLSPELPMI